MKTEPEIPMEVDVDLSDHDDMQPASPGKPLREMRSCVRKQRAERKPLQVT